MSLATNNRNRAFVNLIEKLPAKRQLVYSLIKENEPCTLEDLCNKYGLEKNVSGRFTELKSSCLIKEFGSKINEATNNQNTFYKTVTSDERIDLINLNYGELIEKKDALINDYNLGVSSFSRVLLDKELKKIKSKIKNLENSLDAA